MARLTFFVKAGGSKELYVMAKLRHGSAEKTKFTGNRIPDNKLAGKYRYWDAKKRRVTGYEHEREINALLASWEAKFALYLKDCKDKDSPPDIYLFAQSVDQCGDKLPDAIIALTSEVQHAKANKAKMPLHDLVKEYIGEHRGHMAKKTIQHYDVVANDLQRYDESKKRQTIISTVDYEWYKSFADFLYNDRNNTNLTARGKIHIVGKILKYAHGIKKYIATTDHQKIFNISPSNGNKYALFPDEIAAIQNLHFDCPKRQKVLDAFLFALETGLRTSDVKQLRPEHLREVSAKGATITVINFSAMKTGVETTTPLSDAAIAILQRYHKDGKPYFELGEENCKILRAMAKEAGINRMVEHIRRKGKISERQFLPLHEVLIFAMARNTYISRLLGQGVPLVHVKDNAGHKRVTTTMVYYREDEATRWQNTLAVQNKVSLENF